MYNRCVATDAVHADVFVPSVSGCVGDETALNMHALRACWSAECCMYRYHESPGGMLLGLVEGIVNCVMYMYHEPPGNVLLGLVGGIVNYVCDWPIDGVYRGVSICIENEATYVLMYDFYVLNKPLLLDSAFTNTRSTVPNGPGLTIKCGL